MKQAVALKQTIESHILAMNLGERKPTNLYAPMQYILSEGKRIKPILTLLAYEAAGGLRSARRLI